MIVAHDDARYAAALASVDDRIAAMEATLVRVRVALAEHAMPRCPECGAPFTPADPRQYLCARSACHRGRKTRQERLYRARRGTRARVATLPASCPCGAALRFDMGPGGAAMEACSDPRCAAFAWRPVPRRAA